MHKGAKRNRHRHGQARVQRGIGVLEYHLHLPVQVAPAQAVGSADESAGSGGFRTATGQSMGTPGYMAPEQIIGPPGGIGPAADVHALGAILYEILTGRRPFEEATVPAPLIRTLRDDPAPPRHRNAPRHARLRLVLALSFLA